LLIQGPDEKLNVYFDYLEDDDKHWSVKEAEYCREKLFINIFDTDFQKKLQIAKRGKKVFQGVHSYDILANEMYFDDF
jgi:hypothetical protein